MPFLLFICLLAACVPVDWPRPPFGWGPVGSILATLAVTGGVIGFAACLSFRARRKLACSPIEREQIAQRYISARLFHFFLCLAAFTMSHLFLGWGYSIYDLLTVTIQNGQMVWKPTLHQSMLELFQISTLQSIRWMSLPGIELVLIAPLPIMLIGSWYFFYDVEATFHNTVQTVEESVPFWSRRGYILFNVRQNLLAFIPVLLMMLQQAVSRIDQNLAESREMRLLLLACVPMLLILMPLMLPTLMGLRPLPPGEIRHRLEINAKRLNFRYREIYLWDTRGVMANAMVVGLIPRIRYVILTDRLLTELQDDEVDAVFGHEIGHARYGHLFFYALFFCLSLILMGAIHEAVRQSRWTTVKMYPNWFEMAPILMIGLYMFLVFGFISRRCERQADIFGCRAGSCPNPNCLYHHNETRLSWNGACLCRSGIDAFIRALERVESINGLRKTQLCWRGTNLMVRFQLILRWLTDWLHTWQHSTITKRVDFLRAVTNNFDLEPRFQQQISILKWSILSLLVAGLISIGYFCGWNILVDGL